MCCFGNHIELENKRIWNPITRNVEFLIRYQCLDCNNTWKFTNLEVYP